MSEIEVVRRTIFIVCREVPPHGGELVRNRVQHSEDPTWESKVWKVENVDRYVDQAMDISPSSAIDVRPGYVTHRAKGKRYEIVGLAYCLDDPPSRVEQTNYHRVGVYYRALQRSPHGHGFYWFRPLLGTGGWLTPSGNRDRFERADREQVAV